MAKITHDADYFWKYTTDTLTIRYDFTNDCGATETLSHAYAIVYDENGATVTNTLISATSADTTYNTMDIAVEGGSADSFYEISVFGTSNRLNIFTHKIQLEVIDSITLNAKVADKAQNSYNTLIEANQYIRSKYGHSSKWDSLTIEGKKRTLIEAARDLDKFRYKDEKYYDNQGLAFPRDDHTTVSGNPATPTSPSGFKNTSLYSTTYMTYPQNYWKYGCVHVKTGTPALETRSIDTSSATNGAITVASEFSATVTATSTVVIFAPIDSRIKYAQCEQALHRVQNSGDNSLISMKDLGIRRYRIGDTEVEYLSGESGKISVSSEAKRLLTPWIDTSIRVGRA